MALNSHKKLIQVFSGSRAHGISGMASLFHIPCNEKFSITSIMYEDDEKAAKVFAHELGHTLGMW